MVHYRDGDVSPTVIKQNTERGLHTASNNHLCFLHPNFPGRRPLNYYMQMLHTTP